MAFSQGIRFTISADSSKIRSEFGKVEQMAQATGQKVDQAMKAQQSALQSLANRRKAIDYEQANTVGKIRVVTSQMRDDAKSMAKLEQGSVTWLKARERIETNLAHLRQLQLKAQKEMLKQSPGLPKAGAGGESGALGSLSEGLIKRFIWLGAGAAVSGIIGIARNYFSNQAQIAGAQESSTGVGLASTQARFAATGGLTGQLSQGRASMKGMEALRDFQQNHVNDLKSGLSGLLAAMHPESMKILADAESTLIKMNGELQKQHDTNALLERDLERQRGIRRTILGYEYASTRGSGGSLGSVTIGKEIGSIPETEAALRSGNLNSVTSAQIALRQRNRALTFLKGKTFGTANGTPEEIAEARIAAREAGIDLAKARNNMALFGANFAQGITSDAAGGRSFANGRSRGLSETERLARRAQMFRERARGLILQGSTFGGAGNAIAKARLDEATVSSRLASASASVAQPPGVTDATALKAEIINTNTILKSIDEALKPSNVQ